jgi:thiosulfate/3-mercaptopyruvate sulfurtransferase
MFRHFGHANSSILDGGLPRWEHEQLPVENEEPKSYPPSTYPTPTFDASAIKSTVRCVWKDA